MKKDIIKLDYTELKSKVWDGNLLSARKELLECLGLTEVDTDETPDYIQRRDLFLELAAIEQEMANSKLNKILERQEATICQRCGKLFRECECD